MTRLTLPLDSPRNREIAKRAIDRAPEGYFAEVKEGSRSLEQNAALHGLITQIMKQRTHHNGIRMDMRKWKALFMDALGEEVEFIPNLAGTGVVPLGLSTRELGKERFSLLIELVLAWCAQEGLAVKHFDDTSRDTGAGDRLVKSQPVGGVG